MPLWRNPAWLADEGRDYGHGAAQAGGFIEALAAAVEDVAGQLHAPVILEGYEPPRDPRLQRLMVTPDPGVIEVNIQPAAAWDELVANTRDLYEEARLARLDQFLSSGGRLGPTAPPPEERLNEYPCTLDLRRQPE